MDAKTTPLALATPELDIWSLERIREFCQQKEHNTFSKFMSSRAVGGLTVDLKKLKV